MIHHTFEACGTQWTISIDAESVPRDVFTLIKNETSAFESRFSRFIPESEVNRFRRVKAGTYDISPILSLLLAKAVQLQKITKGGYNASVATLFEKLGYDREYRLREAPEHVSWTAPVWSVKGTKLTIDGPVVFDVGGIGKGFWIDALSELLTRLGFPYHLVDGGGDMMGTSKQSGEGWDIALEWPGKPDMAFGKVTLCNQGLAVSDIFRRSWKGWNHLIHAKTLEPIASVRGCAAVAPSAFMADQLTSAFAFVPEEQYTSVARLLGGVYCVMRADETLCVSPDWRGEFFI